MTRWRHYQLLLVKKKKKKKRCWWDWFDTGSAGAHCQYRGHADVQTGDIVQRHLRERVAQQWNAGRRLRRRGVLLLRRTHRRFLSFFFFKLKMYLFELELCSVSDYCYNRSGRFLLDDWLTPIPFVRNHDLLSWCIDYQRFVIYLWRLGNHGKQCR